MRNSGEKEELLCTGYSDKKIVSEIEALDKEIARLTRKRELLIAEQSKRAAMDTLFAEMKRRGISLEDAIFCLKEHYGVELGEEGFKLPENGGRNGYDY